MRYEPIKLSKNEKESEQVRCSVILRDIFAQWGSELPPVYTQVTKAAASGMSRTMRVFVVLDRSSTIEDITDYVAKATQYTMTAHGVRVPGGGMDMGSHLIGNKLSTALYGETRKLRQRWL